MIEQRKEEEGSVFGWSVLGFLIPIVGLVLWIIWKKDEPRKSTAARNGFIAAIILDVILVIFLGIIS